MTIHIHLFSREIKTDVYIYSTEQLHGLHRNNFTLPFVITSARF